MRSHLLLLSSLLAASAHAQAVRTTIETTPLGVFTRTERGTAMSPLANPNPSPAATRWTYANPPGVPWISEFVSTGNSGTFAWLGQNLNGQRLSLAATTENATPPSPIWEVPKPGAAVVVRAADKSPACAVLTTLNNQSTLEYFTGYSTTPRFTVNQTVPCEVAISDDGRYISLGYTNGSNFSEVSVYDALSGTPGTPIATLVANEQAFRHHDISGDGLWVLLASHTRDHVFSVPTQTEVYSASTVSHDAHAISRDGQAFVRGGFDLGAWMNTPSGWTRVVNFRDNSVGFAVWSAADISADGSTMVAAAYDANTYYRIRIHCFSLAASGGTLLWTYANDGSGTLQDVPTAVSVSDNGKWITVATWGNQANSHPEALLFNRDVGNVPVASIDTPGSVFDADLSGDGQFMLVGTKAVHANVFGNGGAGYSFDRGGQGHRLFGTPSIGRNIQLDTGGNPNEAVVLFMARSLGTPVTIPGFGGTFDLDPLNLIAAIFVGTVPAGGVHNLPLTVPNDTNLVGNTLFTQTLRAGTLLEWDNALRIPFTP